MTEQHYDYGMIGLGTMGRNLVFNMNDHGYSVAGFDKDVSAGRKAKKGGWQPEGPWLIDPGRIRDRH
jgi:6-phosphogluconate dehydrogenase